MTSSEIITINCLDCDSQVLIPLGGREEIVCPKRSCQRKFKAWSKRAKNEAFDFYRLQPSIRRKRLRVTENGRFTVSYVFEEVQRYGAPILGKLIKDRNVLQFLLTGLSRQLEGPVTVIFSEPDPEKIEKPIYKNNLIDRLDGVREQEFYLFLCGFVREVLGCSQCDTCDMKYYSYYSGSSENCNKIRFGEDRSNAPPWRYCCWAGFTEFMCPVILRHETSAIFIKGQYILDSVEGNMELERGKANLERVSPELLNGVDCSLGQIRNLCESLEIIKTVIEIPDDASDEYIVRITSNDLYEIARREAKSLGRYITKSQVETEKGKISSAVEVIEEYLDGIYSNNRRLSEQDFLSELFALSNVLPTEDCDLDEDVWRHTEKILRRICEFLGFKNGAFCVPVLDGSPKLRILATSSCGSTTFGTEQRIISIDNKYLGEIYDRLFDCFFSEESAHLDSTLSFMKDVTKYTYDCEETVTTGWVGYVQLGQELSLKRSIVDTWETWQSPTPFILLALWNRIPWFPGDPGDKISEQTIDFLQRITYELGAGIHSWLSILHIKKAESDRKRLIAENVHGLKTCIHLARNKAEIVETFLEKPNYDNNILRNLLAGIRADLVSFRHQIELANLFTVMEAGRPEYRIVSLESPAYIVNDCIRILEQTAEARDIRFHVDDRLSHGIRIKADTEALKTAFMALLDNAIKYSYENKIIYIRLIEKQTTIEIEIEDFGVGILPSDMERIFLPLERAIAMGPRTYVPGTGIGLTVCRQVIEAHKGNVLLKESTQNPEHYHGTYTSRTAGHKVVFLVRLPIAKRRKKS